MYVRYLYFQSLLLDQLNDSNPPEVPPRAQSLLASLKKHASSQRIKTDECADLKHEEFIPQVQQPGNI